MNGSSATDLVGGEAHHQVAAVVGGALHRLLHHRLADVVEHDVDAAVVGLGEHDLGEVGVVVVDRDVGAELAAELRPSRRCPAVANTRAPACFASWIAAEPEPPAAAWMSTLSPGLQLGAVEEPEPREVEREVERGRVRERDRRRACRTPRRPGRSRTRRSRRARPSASRRRGDPATRSAPSPHASTTPMTSMPGLYGSSGRTIMLPPVMRSRSLRLSGIACTRTRTSPASGVGHGTSSSWSASCGRSVLVGAPRAHRPGLAFHAVDPSTPGHECARVRRPAAPRRGRCRSPRRAARDPRRS